MRYCQVTYRDRNKRVVVRWAAYGGRSSRVAEFDLMNKNAEASRTVEIPLHRINKCVRARINRATQQLEVIRPETPVYR
jgi:hypothetical protein